MGFFTFMRDAIRYMYPRRRWKGAPRQTITKYSMRENVTEDQRLLMLLNKARSPHAASLLMQKHQANNAAELLDKLPPKRRISFGARVNSLLLRLDGDTPGDPYRTDIHNENKF